MRRLAALLIIPAGLAAAQNPGDSFTLIRLLRTSLGSSPAADRDLIQTHRAGRVPVDVIGIESITGLRQAWLIEAHGSFASIEATDKALASVPGRIPAEQGPPLATLIGILRPGLSYRPADAIKVLPSARYFYVTIFQTRPGTGGDFAEVIRIRNAGLEHVNLDRPELGYQVISGADSGMYVFLAPMPSLAVMDEAIIRTWGRPDGIGPAVRQATQKLTTETDLLREQLLFRVDPRISFVSEAFGSPASDFWLAK